MEKNAQDWEIKFLSQIIYLLDMGRIDEWFNDANLLPEIAAYKIGANTISVEMLNDIKSNPDHYRQFIGTKK